MLNIVLFGPPGAGKGTQAAFLKEKYKLIHLSTGELLRSEIAAESELGLVAKAFIERGELVPDDVVVAMIAQLLKVNNNSRGIIFDGFPRTVDQARVLDHLLQENGHKVAGMFALEVDTQELIKRLLERGKTSGRSDDCSVDVIEKRINVYHKKTAPLKNYYNNQGKYYPVNGMGSIDEIADRLDAAVKKL